MCPVESCAGGVARLSSHYVSDPSPSPSHVLFAEGEKMLIGDGLGLEHSWDPSDVFRVEGELFLGLTFGLPLAF